MTAAPSLVDVIAPVADVEVRDHEKGRGKGQRKGKGKGKSQTNDIPDPNNPADPPREDTETVTTPLMKAKALSKAVFLSCSSIKDFV